jgi:predicted DNA-binding transcriptional regulator AlpA
MSTDEKILVTAGEAAALLSIGKSSLWREVKKGKLPAPVKIGSITRWRVADLRACVGCPANRPTTASAPAAA